VEAEQVQELGHRRPGGRGKPRHFGAGWRRCRCGGVGILHRFGANFFGADIVNIGGYLYRRTGGEPEIWLRGGEVRGGHFEWESFSSSLGEFFDPYGRTLFFLNSREKCGLMVR